MDELLPEFLSDAADAFAAVEAVVARHRSSPGDPASLADVLRRMHTIKGTAGFLGLGRLERLAHTVEGGLIALRDGRGGSRVDLCAALRRARGLVDAAASGHPSRVAGQSARTARTVRVEAALIDRLDRLADELSAARRDAGVVLRPTSACLARFDRVAAELEETLRAVAMLPVGEAWAGLDRLAEEAAADLGKRVALARRGGETLIDRRIVDLLRPPLIHLVRNACDHGIEAPDARRAAGKPATGRISIAAREAGETVVVRVVDDGCGLATEAIRRRAQERGLVEAAVLERMPDREVHRLVLGSGLSTADRITPMSGRGVGLDVVQANVTHAGGTVEIASIAGRGTTFTLRLPRMLARPADHDEQPDRTTGSRRLLVVGADGYADQVLAPLLARAGYVVTTAVGPEAAAALDGRENVDAVIATVDAAGTPRRTTGGARDVA